MRPHLCRFLGDPVERKCDSILQVLVVSDVGGRDVRLQGVKVPCWGRGPSQNCTGAILTAGFLGVLLINFPFRLRLPAPTFPEDKPLRSTSCSLFIMLLCKYLTFPVNASEHVCQVISREV